MGNTSYIFPLCDTNSMEGFLAPCCMARVSTCKILPYVHEIQKTHSSVANFYNEGLLLDSTREFLNPPLMSAILNEYLFTCKTTSLQHSFLFLHIPLKKITHL